MKIVMLVMKMTAKNRMRSTLPLGNGNDDVDNGEDKDDGVGGADDGDDS